MHHWTLSWLKYHLRYKQRTQIFGIPMLGFIGFFIAVAAIFYFTSRFFIRKWLKHRRENPPKRKKKNERSIFKKR